MNDLRPDRKFSPEEAEAHMQRLVDALIEQDERFYQKALAQLNSPILKERYWAVQWLALIGTHERWYEAWQAVESHIDSETNGTLRANMACALSMITASNVPGGMFYGQRPRNTLTPYREEIA